MTSPDTKPAKADASAVLAELEWWDGWACPICHGLSPKHFTTENPHIAARRGHAPDCHLYAALQSSSSAEAELRALLTSAKATIALLMADKVDLQARVKVLEEALWAIRAKMREDVEIADEEDGPCLVPLDDDIVLRDIDNLLSAALNHGKGEDARAAVGQAQDQDTSKERGDGR